MKDPVFDVFRTITFYLYLFNKMLNNFNPPERFSKIVFEKCIATSLLIRVGLIGNQQGVGLDAIMY